MPEMLSNEITKELVDGLIKIFDESLNQIILYGSVARGEAHDESDIDIAIIVDGEISRNVRESLTSWNVEMDLKYDKVFSIIDIEQEKLDKWGKVLPFYRNVCEEGIILWKTA